MKYNGVDINELLKLIKSEPGDDLYIYKWEKEWRVTDEWLVGVFAGGGFGAKTIEDASKKLIDYFNRHIGHNSIVGREVTRSGWPDLNKVKSYLEKEREGEILKA